MFKINSSSNTMFSARSQYNILVIISILLLLCKIMIFEKSS